MTVSLKQVSVGTELSIVQEGVPEAIPAEACYLAAEACYLGWQQSMLVEAEIQG